MSKDKSTNRSNIKISVYCVYMVLLRPCKHSTLFHLKSAFKNGHHHSDSLKSASLSLPISDNTGWPSAGLPVINWPGHAPLLSWVFPALLPTAGWLPCWWSQKISSQRGAYVEAAGGVAWDCTAARRAEGTAPRLRPVWSGCPACTGLRAAPPRAGPLKPTGLVPPPNLCQTAGTWPLVHYMPSVINLYTQFFVCFLEKKNHLMKY